MVLDLSKAKKFDFFSHKFLSLITIDISVG